MKTSTHVPKDTMNRYLHVARKYAGLIFVLFLLAIYGFLSMRIMQLTQAEPDPTAVAAELKTVGVPAVDEEVVEKLEKLKDNSVSVQTLFDEARSNPFQE